MSHVTVITDNKYEDFIINNHKAIICYSSSQCPICFEMDPLYNRIATRYNNRVSFAIINVEDNGLKMESTPIFEGYLNGKIIKYMDGVDTVALKQFIKGVINAK